MSGVSTASGTNELLAGPLGGWGCDSVVKNMECSSKGAGYPHGHSQLSVTLVPRNLKLLASEVVRHPHSADIHLSIVLIYIK